MPERTVSTSSAKITIISYKLTTFRPSKTIFKSALERGLRFRKNLGFISRLLAGNNLITHDPALLAWPARDEIHVMAVK
jgi:hypothetical protein